MNGKIYSTLLLLMVAALFSADRLQGQQPGEQTMQQAIYPQPVATLPEQELPPTDDPAPTTDEVRLPSLDGGPLLTIDPRHQANLLYGVGYSQAWGDPIGSGLERSGVSGSSALAPYVGLTGEVGTMQFALQYASTLTHYQYDGKASLPMESYHTGSISLLGKLSTRWDWSLSDDSNYGNGMLQAISPITSTAIGTQPVTVPTFGAGSLTGNSVLGNDARLRLDWQENRKQTISFEFDHIYYAIQGEPWRRNDVGFETKVNRTMSPTWSLLYYAQVIEPMTDTYCVSIGGGVGVDLRMAKDSELRIEGGPQFTRQGCILQQAANYAADFVHKFSMATAIYLTAHRQGISDQSVITLPTAWEDGTSAGVTHTFQHAVNARADWGFARGSLALGQSSFRSNFVNLSVEHQLNSVISLGGTYRNFYNSVGPQNLTRNVFLFSIYFRKPPADHQRS